MRVHTALINYVEYLRVFTRFPQTTRVFFGGTVLVSCSQLSLLSCPLGGHDNGYASTVNQLQNEGHLDKLILLRGYKDLAHEINSLNLPQLEIEGVFITKKLHTNYATKKVAAAAAAAAAGVPNSDEDTQSINQPEGETKSRKQTPAPIPVSHPNTPARPAGGKTLNPGKPQAAKAEAILDLTMVCPHHHT